MKSALLLAFLVLIVGIILTRLGRRAREVRGLSDALTLDLDERNLYSARHRLACRPDRVNQKGGAHVPEEWKSSLRVYDSHRAQLGVQLIGIEKETGIRPPHGYIVTGDGTRHRIENTDELRAWVLDVAEQIRAARRDIDGPIWVRQPPGKCRKCGVREHCEQKSVAGTGPSYNLDQSRGLP